MLLHEASRLATVTRWLEWIGISHGIYNVINAHQCFNERPRAIVRPFHEETNFYGCFKCGKYHFCYNSHHTCDSVAPTLDINNNMPTCAYSGRTIRNVHNEVIGNHTQSENLKSDMRNGMHIIHSDDANNSSGPTGSAAAETRRMNTLDNIVYHHKGNKVKKTQTKLSGSPSKKEKRLIDKQNMNQYFFKRGNEAAGINPIITTTSENADGYREQEKEKEREKEGMMCVEEFGIMDYDIDGDDGDEPNDDDDEPSSSSTEMIVDTNTIEGIMKMNQQLDNEMYHLLEYDPLVHGQPYDDQYADEEDGSDEDAMAYDDLLIRMKNPHDNVVFWDEYYSFLIHGDTLPVFTVIPTDEEDGDEASTNNYTTNSEREQDDELSKKDEGGHHIYDTAHPRHLFKVDPSRWDGVTSRIVKEEVYRIIEIIMRTYMLHKEEEDMDKGMSEVEYKSLLKNLTMYYHNIVSNILILIYHSPHIQKLALQRHEKHEKQGKSSYSAKITVTVTDISSVLEADDATNEKKGCDHYQNPRDLVCPKKVCASLMLHLFTEMFFLCDSMTNHICIWVKDPWLTHMKNEVFNEIIMDYNIIVDPLNHNKKKVKGKGRTHLQYENIFFKKDLTAMSTTIRTSLSAYNCHPMWLSNMIYTFKRQ